MDALLAHKKRKESHVKKSIAPVPRMAEAMSALNCPEKRAKRKGPPTWQKSKNVGAQHVSQD